MNAKTTVAPIGADGAPIPNHLSTSQYKPSADACSLGPLEPMVAISD